MSDLVPRLRQCAERAVRHFGERFSVPITKEQRIEWEAADRIEALQSQLEAVRAEARNAKKLLVMQDAAADTHALAWRLVKATLNTDGGKGKEDE